MQTNKEIWRSVKGFENSYKVSNSGRIKSLSRCVNHAYGGLRTLNEKILKTTTMNIGYKMVSLHDGNPHKFLVHRIVAIAFIPNHENKPQINHKNGIRDDNRLENLEWCTRSENMLHSCHVLGNQIGELQHQSKLKECDVLEIRRLYALGNISYRLLGIKFGICIANTFKVVNRKSWKHI